MVAIDGKTVRGSRQAGQHAIHLVSAYGCGLGLVLGQVRTADKSNEVTAIPELLDALLLKGAIVTIGAMGCQRSIAERIVADGADYVLAVKENPSALLARVRKAIDAMENQLEFYADFRSEHCEIDKDHGHLETRRRIVTDILSRWGHEPDLWPGMRSVVMVEAKREIGETTSVARRYYVTSLAPDAARIANAVRSHWRIENPMHWVLDMEFGEDQCRARVENAAQNFIILQRSVLKLAKSDATTKAGLKNRRVKACANDNYRAALLGL